MATSRVASALLQTRALTPRNAAVSALERAGLSKDLLTFDAADTVQADATLLARALGNLLDIAKKHGGAVDRLVVRKGDSTHVVFEVHDKGPGIPADALTRIFEPFERAGEKKGRRAGARPQPREAHRRGPPRIRLRAEPRAGGGRGWHLAAAGVSRGA